MTPGTMGRAAVRSGEESSRPRCCTLILQELSHPMRRGGVLQLGRKEHRCEALAL